MHIPMQHAVLYILQFSYISSDQHLAKEKTYYETENEIFPSAWYRKCLNFVLLGLILLILKMQYKEHYTLLYLSLLISLKLCNNRDCVIIQLKQ